MYAPLSLFQRGQGEMMTEMALVWPCEFPYINVHLRDVPQLLLYFEKLAEIGGEGENSQNYGCDVP
jgi:hypothetical protein